MKKYINSTFEALVSSSTSENNMLITWMFRQNKGT